jgi:hypothetical protein
MPNWCSNVVTINHGDKEKIDAIETELNKEKDDVALFQMLYPRPAEHEEDWYGWNVNNWGTKWEASIYDFERLDDNNIRVNFDTAWGPPIALYDYLFGEGYDTTAYYDECGMGFCGKYEFGSDDQYDYTDMDSAQVQDEIPSDIDEMFSISEQMQDREMEEEFEDEVEFESQDTDEEDDDTQTYEMTEWFDVKIEPVHIGLYDVQYDKPNAWPFPSRLNWTGKKWMTDNGEERYDVGQWRGITDWQHQMIIEMEELKAEFEKSLETESE